MKTKDKVQTVPEMSSEINCTINYADLRSRVAQISGGLAATADSLLEMPLGGLNDIDSHMVKYLAGRTREFADKLMETLKESQWDFIHNHWCLSTEKEGTP